MTKFGDTYHDAGPQDCPPARAAFAGIQSATILKPGDRVLIDCGRGARLSDIDALSRKLKEWFPDVQFAVLGGVQVVAVEEAIDR